LLMTRRRRLDAFLAERADAAGADFRDGVRVGALAQENGRVTAEIDGRAVEARVLIGADGANGTAARAFGLCPKPFHGVGLEGTLLYEHLDAQWYRRRAVFEIGNVAGGYGWVFPKEDHVNVGVGGYPDEAPRLREHLARLCRAHGFSERQLGEVRGHRLPVSRGDAPLARGRALVVGDAAGLVDPLSGDGLYEAFVSAALAANATLDLLEGRARDLEPYQARIKAALLAERTLSLGAKSALDHFPRLVFAVAGTELVQTALERLARGEPPSRRALPRVLRRLLTMAAPAMRRLS
jgi:flavin-dependent dehydrogenase